MRATEDINVFVETPKCERSARTIPFGWSERLTCMLMTFFDEYDCLKHTQQGINNIITAAAENAPGISPENFSAHNLRATGLTFLANTSLDPKMLCDLAGWEDLQTARKYLRQSGHINTAKMYQAMGRAESAPLRRGRETVNQTSRVPAHRSRT